MKVLRVVGVLSFLVGFLLLIVNRTVGSIFLGFGVLLYVLSITLDNPKSKGKKENK
jgi:small-conductance mechanosensitive channel